MRTPLSQQRNKHIQRGFYCENPSPNNQHVL
jgi:hypothetical protein